LNIYDIFVILLFIVVVAVLIITHSTYKKQPNLSGKVDKYSLGFILAGILISIFPLVFLCQAYFIYHQMKTCTFALLVFDILIFMLMLFLNYRYFKQFTNSIKLMGQN